MNRVKIAVIALASIFVIRCSYITNSSVSAEAVTASAETPTLFVTHTTTQKMGWVRSIAFSSDGEYLAIGTSRGISLFQTQNWDRLWTVETRSEIISLAFSHKNGLLATGDTQGKIELYESDTGKSQLILRGHTGRVFDLAWSSDDLRIASASADFSTIIWTIEDGLMQYRLSTRGTKHFGSMQATAWSRDDSLLATGDADGQAIVWDSASGSMRKLIPAFTFQQAGAEVGIRDIVWSPDSLSLLINGDGGQAGIWDVDTGQLQSAPKLPPISQINWTIDHQPFGIETRADGFGLYDLQTGVSVYELAGADNGATVATVALDLVHSLLVADGADHIVRVWNLETGQLLVALEGFSE